MLDPKTFRCERCGECCNKYIIKLSRKDIREIEKLGYKDFYEYDRIIGSNVLKKVNHECIFIKKKGGKYLCQIYRSRPLVCKRYPFFKKDVKSCKPVLLGELFKKLD